MLLTHFLRKIKIWFSLPQQLLHPAVLPSQTSRLWNRRRATVHYLRNPSRMYRNAVQPDNPESVHRQAATRADPDHPGVRYANRAEPDVCPVHHELQAQNVPTASDRRHDGGLFDV